MTHFYPPATAGLQCRMLANYAIGVDNIDLPSAKPMYGLAAQCSTFPLMLLEFFASALAARAQFDDEQFLISGGTRIGECQFESLIRFV